MIRPYADTAITPEGSGSEEYGTMEYHFPGAEEYELDTAHQDILP